MNKIISIDSELKDFKEYLTLHDRCIFSARFGDGKSYFLSKFMNKYQKQYLFIPIYPINYQVADNKDIFEYIKRDILIRLLASGEIDINDAAISNSIYLYFYLQHHKIDFSLDLLNIAPDINLNGTDINLSAFGLVAKTISKIKNKFNEYKSKSQNEEQKAEDFLDAHEKGKGSIYEFDVISQLICDLIAQYRIKYKNRRKVVLLIEDLDRIDPAHIFRILNIFSAHFDRYNASYTEVIKTQGRNKFNLDKVITVCHYDNIKTIYSHLYGINTDFNGYIDKFSSASPFSYSLRKGFKEHILSYIDIELKKYISVCDCLADMIIEKYQNLSSGLYGNLRHINYQLSKSYNIKEELINIGNEHKVSSINNLTKILTLLHRFNLKWSDLVEKLKEKSRYSKDQVNNVARELDNIIGICWLISCKFNPQINIYYHSSHKGFVIQHENRMSVSLETKSERNIVTNLDFRYIYDNSDLLVLLKRVEPLILNCFNNFLINSNEETIK